MATSEQIASDVLNLPPEQFFAYDEDLNGRLVERLSKLDFQGLAIAAPREIDARRHATLPLILATSKSGLRDWEVEFRQNCALVAVDLRSGQTYSATAFPPKPGKRLPDKPEERGPRPNATMASARITGTYCFDLRKTLDLPGRDGEYAVTVLSYDWKSNTIVLRLIGSAPQSAPVPESAAPATASVAAALRSARPGPNSPKLNQPGIALQLVSGEPGAKTGAWAAYGALRLNARDAHVRAKAPGAAANVPVTLAAIALDWKAPRLIPLQVPAHSEANDSPGDAINAYFEINLLEAVSEPLPPGEYLLYAFCDQFAAGPQRWTVR